MSQTILYLIRHGETDANVAGVWQGSTDSPLNARGEAQARALARHLADERLPIAAIYTSPLQRARQTATIIARALGDVPVIVDSGLAEFHLGEWEGLTYEQLREEKQLWKRMGEDPDFAPPGGESARDFAMRLLHSIQTIVQTHAGESVGVVGHGGAMATALALLLDGDGSRWRDYLMHNASLSKLLFDPEPRLLFFSDVSHLKGVGNLEKWR
ncbi:MAG TPA: histidine phosphatase family protein [Anaerolineae bacterium]|nr:histidine phosphatase family protein [Caldilineae bacterium]HID35609.1 histidine phosphatase family protein [Anaerolineae bacterium]